MNPELLERWTRFLAGHWTRQAPTEPGFYRICSVDGSPESTSQSILAYRDPRSGKVETVTPWGGWRWSVPTPELPPLPGT